VWLAQTKSNSGGCHDWDVTLVTWGLKMFIKVFIQNEVVWVANS